MALISLDNRQNIPGPHLQIGGVFVVKITTKTARSGLEELAWADFNILAVEKNQEAFLDESDIVDIVLVPK